MFFLSLAIIAVTFVQVTAVCWISPPPAGNSYRGGMLEKRYDGVGCSLSSTPIPYYYDLKNIVGECVKQDGVHAGKWGKRSVGSYTNPNTGKTKKGTFKYIYTDSTCTQLDQTQTGSPNCSGCSCPNPVSNPDIDWEVNVCSNTVSTLNGGYSMTKTFTTELLSAKPGYGTVFAYGTQEGCQTKNNQQLKSINLSKPSCNPGEVVSGSPQSWRSASCDDTTITVYDYSNRDCTQGKKTAYTLPKSLTCELAYGQYMLFTCATASGTPDDTPDDTTSDGGTKPKSKTGTVLLFLVVAFGFFFGGGYYTLIYLPEKQKAEVLAARDAKLAREAAEAPATTNPVHENGINPMNNA